MKNLLRKRISMALLMAICICCSLSVGVSAQEIGKAQVVENTSVFAQSLEIQPRADIIEIKYRIYNGMYQQRRWNRTGNYWVDPYWINC